MLAYLRARGCKSLVRTRDRPKLKIGYWAIRGLAAPLRMAAAYGGLAYESVEYELQAKPGGGWDRSEWMEKSKKKGFKKGSRSEPVMLGTPRKRADLTVEEAMLGTTEERTERAIDEADAKARAILWRAILPRNSLPRNSGAIL